MENFSKKGIVISGGGSRGSFAVGVAKYLINDLGKDYDLYIGTSTGSLITSLLPSRNIEKLHEAYTSITQKDIFKVNPIKMKNGQLGINYLNILYNTLIRRKKTLGDSSNLRKLIDRFITKDDYYNIIKDNKEVISCVTNLNSGKKEFKSTNNCKFEDFCDWIYASACAAPFMSTVEKDGFNYADGGFIDAIPIQEAINRGCTEIDIIVLRPEETPFQEFKYTNVISLLSRLIDIMISEISKNDIDVANLLSKIDGIKLNFYYTPTMLTFDSLIFNKDEMNEWYNSGYLYAKGKYHKSYILNRDYDCKLVYNGNRKLDDQS